jgi:peptidoglycan/xylan/chitin deacetylase (PgdA/CDA1 family)
MTDSASPEGQGDEPMSVREGILRLLDGVGAIDGMLRLRRVVALPWLTVLCYHRTAERTAAGGMDHATIDATPAQFDAQLALLGEHFTFVGVDDVVAFARGGRLPANPVLVSFDDGYRDCLTTALPLLLRHKVPAVFFIPTHFVSERRMFWWDRIAWTLKHSKKDRLALSYPNRIELVVKAKGTIDRAHRITTTIVKRWPELDLERFLGELEKAADVALDPTEERSLVDAALMTWDEIGALSRAGMGIGSHTRNHRVLQTLPRGDYGSELSGSRLEIEERLGKPVESIAYPVGYGIGSHPDLQRAVRDAGYEVGFTCKSGALRTRGPLPDMLDVPRFLMDMSYDQQVFAAVSALPALANRTAIDIA